MEVDFTETDLHGLSAGFEFGSGGGAISKDGRQFDEIIEAAEKLETTRYEARFGGSTRAHFALGSSLLTAQGRHLLGFLAASELATLSRLGTRLDLIGSADRVDVEWYNQLLSEVRAQNALQYLEDVLGKELRATTRAVGLGEQLPRDAGMEDGTEAPEYRRVYVEYEGRAIANLQVSRK